MIKVSNLSFGYSKRHLLYQNLSLNLQKGNIYGLLGKNGAGKSTLLKNIAGILFPSRGSVNVDGMDPGKRNPSFLKTVYYIPEEVYVPSLTIRQYLSLYTVFYPLFNLEQFHTYLKELEVEVPGKLNALSFGQQKKFIIAFGLACNTSLMLMDEPTNGLDIPSKSQFRKLIASIMTDERIILISTHQTRDLENLIDQVIIVDNGQLLLDTSMDEVSTRLYFETVRQLPSDKKILYTENDLRGISIVRENLTGEDSRINLEYLFNGVTAQPTLTKEIFQTTNS
jgi:ABC-2 type transport system ATP-binding protein